jgi:hypothetical protein
MGKYDLNKKNGFLLLDCLVAMAILILLFTHNVVIIKQIRQSFLYNITVEETLNAAVNDIISQQESETLNSTPTIKHIDLNTQLTLFYAN